MTQNQAQHTAVIGMQWGDEGKGKFVDLLAPGHAAVVRFNGGANAGHSVVVEGERFSLHQIPSGILTPGRLAVIGNGVVVDPRALLKEIDTLSMRGVDVSGLVISSRAHVVFEFHKREDELREELLASRAGGAPIGTTRRGIGPAYADKAQRTSAIRTGDLLKPEVLSERLRLACEIKRRMLSGLGGGAAEFDAGAILEEALAAGARLAPMIRDTSSLLHDLADEGKSLLFEGANSTLLDVDHGTYPFVTSSTCTIAGVGVGAGFPPQRIARVIGVMKAYSTRVGAGPLTTELHDETGERIRRKGREFGTTTGRPRRVGWLDLAAVRYSARVNGVTGLAVSLLDVLAGQGELRVCTGYRIDGRTRDDFVPDGAELMRAEPIYTVMEGFTDDLSAARRLSDLPTPARKYLSMIEKRTGVPVAMVGVGPGREQTIEA